MADKFLNTKGRTPSNGALRTENEPGAGPPVGIVAGGGTLPLSVAKSILAQGRRVHIVAIRGAADPAIAQFDHSWCNWGALGALLRQLKQAECRELVIVGSVRRPDINTLRPDLGFFSNIPAIWPLLRGGDDSVLSKVVRFFEGRGFIVRGAHEFAPQLLPPTGALGAISPQPAQVAAIARAAALITALGPFDIGQAALANADQVIAFEGAGGTDAMIRSAMTERDDCLAAGGADQLAGAVLVKLPKPGQEMRIDMPAIGPQTVDLVREAGLAGIGVAAGRSILLQRETLLRRADAAQIFIVGLDGHTAGAEDGQSRGAYSADSASGTGAVGGSIGSIADVAIARSDLDVLGRYTPTKAHWRDIARGRRLMIVLERLDSGMAAVVARDYVLALHMRGSVGDLLRQAQRAKPWAGLLAGRRGVLVLGGRDDNSPTQCDTAFDLADYPALTARDLAQAGRDKLAGIVFADAPVDQQSLRGFIRAADAARLFVVGRQC